jgi:hypothetical protein
MARRLLAPLSIAARRIAARPGSVLLTGFGIAIAAAALTTLLVSQVVVEDRAVEDSIGQLPVERRLVAVSWVGQGTSGRAALDREARRALASLGVGEPVRAVAFRSTRLGTEIVRLAAVDGAVRARLARRAELAVAELGSACRRLGYGGARGPRRRTRRFDVPGRARPRRSRCRRAGAAPRGRWALQDGDVGCGPGRGRAELAGGRRVRPTGGRDRDRLTPRVPGVCRPCPTRRRRRGT